MGKAAASFTRNICACVYGPEIIPRFIDSAALTGAKGKRRLATCVVQ
jgi:hypothetical protein